jgi:hypothetical protein
VNHIVVIVVVNQKVYQNVANHAELLLQYQVGIVHALVLHFRHFIDFFVQKNAQLPQRITLIKYMIRHTFPLLPGVHAPVLAHGQDIQLLDDCGLPLLLYLLFQHLKNNL